nr:GNAT family N-acetyltransferase [Nocardia transvalensis]
MPVLRDIERAAGAGFAEIGMTAVAEDEPPSSELFAEFQTAGRAWVYVGETDVPVAFILVSEVDGNGHVDQVSVRPDHAGNRIGQALIEHAMSWACATGLPALTLTTFTDVPWNGPYYEKLGFRYLRPDEETPRLREIRQAEAEHGLDRWPRACMRIDLPIP